MQIDDNTGFDEPEQSPTTDRNAVAITQDMGRVQNALGEFDRVSAGLAAIEARYPKDAIYEVGTTKGMKNAVEHRAAWRDPRITVEKARKMAKAPLIALGKSIDARAAWITEQLRLGEEPIDQLIKAEETRREEERQAKINAEAGRVLAIQEDLAGISEDTMIACGKTSADVLALLDQMRGTEPDRLVFQEMIDQARAAWSASIAKLETAHKAKLWDEEEQRRAAEAQAAESARRAEEESRLTAVAKEQAAEAARQKQEADRLAAERVEFERQRAEFAASKRVSETPAPEVPSASSVTLVNEPAAIESSHDFAFIEASSETVPARKWIEEAMAAECLRDLRGILTKQDALMAQLAVALEDYMSAFGQCLDACGITMGPQQVEADDKARAALAAAKETQ